MRPIVLWISRHRPLPVQERALQRKIGLYHLVQIDRPLSTADEAVELARFYKADYVVPVLPLSFIVRLVEASKHENFTILRAEMEVVDTCKECEGFNTEDGPVCEKYDEETDVIMRSKDFSSGETIYRHFRFLEFKKLVDIKIEVEDW